MEFFKKCIFASIIMISQVALALSDEQIVEKFIPPKMIVDKSGSKIPIGNEQIYLGETYKWVDLDGKGKTNYLVIVYKAKASLDVTDELVCTLVVIKKEGRDYKVMGETTTQFPDETEGCFEVLAYDLDNNKKQEIILTRILGRVDGPPAIFKWDGKRLISITPIETVGKEIYNAFDSVAISSDRINGKYLLANTSPDSDDPPQFYEMLDGKIVLKDMSTLDFFAEKTSHKPVQVKKAVLAGDYILEVKNVSSHNRTVRADIYVNGKLVLKAKDFCKHPNPPKWVKKHKGAEDDDDDLNEDNCKRCEPQNSVSVPLKVKAPLDFKIRIYGKKNSKLQITLKKKK